MYALYLRGLELSWWVVVFVFKQKTAYEMRMSDWSSDVCSSDLPAGHPCHRRGGRAPRSGLCHRRTRGAAAPGPGAGRTAEGAEPAGGRPEQGVHLPVGGCRPAQRPPLRAGGPEPADRQCGLDRRHRRLPRSEEHTSELQSLMRISYAVFCLKKKT